MQESCMAFVVDKADSAKRKEAFALLTIVEEVCNQR